MNHSQRLFAVDQEGDIRFGLVAIKGVGQGVVEAIVKERRENGPYKSIFDMTERVPAPFPFA